MRFCANPNKGRFGVIEFAIGAKVTQSFKRAVGEVEESQWSRLYRKTDKGLVATGQEYAEVCFVPEELARKKDGPVFRYLAIREVCGATGASPNGPATFIAVSDHAFRVGEIQGVRDGHEP